MCPSKVLFKDLMDYIVLRNIYPSALRLMEASKMSQNHFPLCSGSEVPWKLPQIFMFNTHWSTEVLLAPVYEPAPQREMTLCHCGATRIYTPVHRTSNKHNSNRSPAWKKANFVLRHSCPSLTYVWKPWSLGSFQTAFTPQPPLLSHTHTYARTHTRTHSYKPLLFTTETYSHMLKCTLSVIKTPLVPGQAYSVSYLKGPEMIKGEVPHEQTLSFFNFCKTWIKIS